MKLITAAWVATVLAGSAGAQEDGAREVRDRLSATRVTLDFTDAKLSEVVSYLQEFSGLNFHFDPRTPDGQEPARISIKLKDVSLKTALKLLLTPRDLGCVLREGILVITPRARLGSRTVTRVYDVRDLVNKLEDFPGPRFELDENKSGLRPDSFFIREEPMAVFDGETLVDLIKTSLDRRAWEDDPAVSISPVNGLLVVSQTRAMHEEVRGLLDRLRQYK